jgi:hypothetical protein
MGARAVDWARPRRLRRHDKGHMTEDKGGPGQFVICHLQFVMRSVTRVTERLDGCQSGRLGTPGKRVY